MAFSLNDYEILDVIGTGGFGTVYRARQKSLGRIVAIKCLSPHRTQNQSDLMRFRREAEAMAALAHDNIISIIDYAYASGSYYIVMEYVNGITYQEALSRKIPVELSIHVLEKTASALRCAHEKGIVHRDIKPANIFLGENGQVRLADFGLALFEQNMTSQSAQAAIGTLSYMAPETMVSPSEVDARADLFSLGCLLFEALSGSAAFPGKTMAEVSYNILNTDVTAPPVECRFDPISSLAQSCLSKDREKRPDIGEILQILQAALRELPEATSQRLGFFVRNEIPAGPVIQSSAPVTTAVPQRGLVVVSKRYRMFLYAAAVLILALSGWSIIQTRTRTVPVPSIRMIEEASRSIISGLPPSTSQTVPVPGDAPPPMVGDVVDTRGGTLVITGLQPDDTVFLDGSSFQSGEARTLTIPVESGHHRLIVRRLRGVVCEKEVEVRPYQKLEWNVNDTSTRSAKR